MPGVDTRPMGSGSAAPANCHASPPSTSFTSLGALSRCFFGSHVSQMSVGSRMWQSPSTIEYLGMRQSPSHLTVRQKPPAHPWAGSRGQVERQHADGVAAHDLPNRLVV